MIYVCLPPWKYFHNAAHYKGRAIIGYYMRADRVAVVGIFYGGQDYETMLQADTDDAPEH